MTKKKKLTTTNTEDAWCEDFWWRKHARLGSGNLCVFSWKIRTSFGVRLTSPPSQTSKPLRLLHPLHLLHLLRLLRLLLGCWLVWEGGELFVTPQSHQQHHHCQCCFLPRCPYRAAASSAALHVAPAAAAAAAVGAACRLDATAQSADTVS